MQSTPMNLGTLFETNGIKYKVTKNQLLFAEGDPADMIYFILSGKVALTKETANGRALTLRICSKNDCIAEGILFTSSSLYPVSAKVLEETFVIGLKKGQLERLLAVQPDLLVDCIEWLQIQNMREQSKLRDLLLYGKKGALYSTLIRLANTYGELQSNGQIEISHLITHGELATLCATSREVINRLVQQLKKDHVIQYEQNKITILNLHYLRAICECDHCPIFVCQIN
ncbi:Crp/Fnr family transcriptional regulator [Kurthia sibirica]|uniref:Crp/Fnr family transcriptional regulator n=1 Tax=Kurthia sibirica TaxID=202750 RepID=A0A2U3AMU7_9BACL|nr:Crp/Fnr family transcriptional regulator [Kurthia sibirica]PWI25841.1 Crp/Fnr family transcriptional regulator [Kurthia sibirica]GEK33660.1 anaerobic regulatory protein [Kurthia sibirica]